jgi:hypothetical protein
VYLTLAAIVKQPERITPRIITPAADDLWRAGKIIRFNCHPEGSAIFAQLGLLTNLHAALTK